jgi:hypothetical protein
MPIKKAKQCKDKKGRTLAIGDEVIVRGKVIDLPMDLEEGGRAIVIVQWHGAIPLSSLVESKELEKAAKKKVTVENNKKPSKHRESDGAPPPPEYG